MTETVSTPHVLRNLSSPHSGDKSDFSLHSGDSVGFYLSVGFCTPVCVETYLPGNERYDSIFIQKYWR